MIIIPIMNSYKKIVVTGSAGFIGATFCYEALKKGYKILGVDNYSNSSSVTTEILKTTFPDFSFSELDVSCELRKLTREIETFNPNLIVHLASLNSVTISEDKPDLYWKNNLNSTENILKVMEKITANKIIFSSSASVYGSFNKQPVNEESLLEPLSVYGKTKLACENLIKDNCNDGNLDAVIFRYFNLSGSHKEKLFFNTAKTSENLMSKIIEVAKGNLEEITIYGKDHQTIDGTASRDYIHIDDLISAHFSMIKVLNKISGADVYNLGTGKETTVLDLLETFKEVNKIPIKYIYGKSRSEDISRSFTNPLKIENISGWKTKKNLKDICYDSWNAIK